MNYHHLTIEERSCIRKYYVDGLSYREIARLIGRNVSTVSREIRRNCSHMYDIPTYYPHTAQKKYLLRRSYCHRGMFHSQEVLDYIEEKLRATWSPEQIACTPCELKLPSWRTIYRWIYEKYLVNGNLKVLRHKGKSHGVKETRGKYSKGKSIRKRDKSVYSREEAGHWEADTVVSGQGKSKACFATLAERKTRFYIAMKMSDRRAETMENAIVAALSAFPPQLVKTITCDRGTEFANWRRIEERYNAFVAQGCAPEEAERRTVESMGDPVLAGGALDRVHRPRPAWGPFFMVAALLLAGALLRFFWSVPVSAQGVYLWREGAYQSLAAALAGIAVLAAVYFCMDVSLLARWTKALYIGLAAVSAYGFLAGYTLMNGRRLWTVWGVSYDATHFSMIFIPIYAAVVYRQRGRGWAGLLVSGFAIVPGLWLCIMVPHLAAACVLGLAGLAVCLVCCAGDWYGLGGKKSFAVVLGVTAGSLVVTFLLVLLLMPGLAGSLQRHLEVLLAPDANAAGAGYWMNALRRMWDGMRWLGPGDGSLPLGEKAALGTVGEFAGKAVRELRADYLLAYAGWRYGIACAAALAAAVAGALAWLWRTALRTRSGIGRLCAVGCCALLTMHGVLNLLSCLGWSSARGMLPFLDGGWTGVMQAGLAGLLLSAFRLDDVLREPQGTCAPKAPARLVPAGRFAYSDGTLHIRLR